MKVSKQVTNIKGKNEASDKIAHICEHLQKYYQHFKRTLWMSEVRTVQIQCVCANFLDLSNNAAQQVFLR